MITTGANGDTARISPGDGCVMHLELSKLTMQDLADTLAPFLDKPVIDATELKGTYKATLVLPMEVMFTVMQNIMRANGLPGPGQEDWSWWRWRRTRSRRRSRRPWRTSGMRSWEAVANGGADTSSAALFRAVQKLGLRLQARKALFDTIVIDHIEKNAHR